MAETVRVVVETGPKGRKAVAVAPDWAGLERGGKTEDEALSALAAYVPRYEPVARAAELHGEYPRKPVLDVVERYQGTGSTDFWGISFGFSSLDQQPLTDAELERQLRLVQASWATFDVVRRRVSAEMRRGPRGGGRQRDEIVRHVLGVEQDWGKKVGVRAPARSVVEHDEELAAFREEYLEAVRRFATEGRPARTWPLRYLIRHTAYHTLDHAWEMEDKDLGR